VLVLSNAVSGLALYRRYFCLGRPDAISRNDWSSNRSRWLHHPVRRRMVLGPAHLGAALLASDRRVGVLERIEPKH
jgi:hypothetical protein